MYNIHQFRRKASEKPAQEPVEETPAELRERLTQELQVMDQEDDKEEEEEQQQKIHEHKTTTPHWRQARAKPGPKNKEEDEALKERFPDDQVSFASNYDQCINLILSFSVSAVCKKDQAGNSWGVPQTPQTQT